MPRVNNTRWQGRGLTTCCNAVMSRHLNARFAMMLPLHKNASSSPPPTCSGWQQGCRFVFLSIQGVGREGLWVLILIGIDMAHSDLDGFCPPTLTTTTTHPTIAHLKPLKFLWISKLQIPEPRQPRLTPFYGIIADTLRQNRDKCHHRQMSPPTWSVL